MPSFNTQDCIISVKSFPLQPTV